MLQALIARAPLIILLFSFVSLLTWLNWPEAETALNKKRGDRAVKVVAEQARVKPFIDKLFALGTAQANEAVNLYSQSAGRVQDILFDDGQAVKKGQELIRLVRDEEKAEIAELKAKLAEAKAQLARLTDLTKKNSAAQSALDAQRAEAQAIAAQLKQAQAKYEKFTVKAPFDGVLGLRNISVGAFVSTSTTITTLDDTRSIKVDFTVPEKELNRLAIEQQIEVKNAAHPDTTFTGIVTSIDSRIDPTTRAINIRAKIDNEKGLLKPGMLLDISLVRSNDQAMFVDEKAVFPKADKQFVYLVIDDKAVLTQVEIGRRRPGIVEITAGVEQGQNIVVEGAIKLRNGAAVTMVTEG
ncbi:efflux RND transporter periplasmic adaptor subunit [Catenovulum sp. SM1970]|uniref:efflux RND transporter periplasmic adaptor subunit n=1 Tax=Marinifaba aquimaris TaxID=2741323 RepID=UPI001573A6C9|nr:efflux RND transporter periplasmic adaptor subunit [Marinifaba aquimaris]NTS75344.1 efflux RND transporter periplasmic adaptor subunit [Marinifaba aquimaris]